MQKARCVLCVLRNVEGMPKGGCGVDVVLRIGGVYAMGEEGLRFEAAREWIQAAEAVPCER